MRKFRKVLFFKIMAICLSLCIFIYATGYAAPNLRINSMFDKIKEDKDPDRPTDLLSEIKIAIDNEGINEDEYRSTISVNFFSLLKELLIDIPLCKFTSQKKETISIKALFLTHYIFKNKTEKEKASIANELIKKTIPRSNLTLFLKGPDRKYGLYGLIVTLGVELIKISLILRILYIVLSPIKSTTDDAMLLTSIIGILLAFPIQYFLTFSLSGVAGTVTGDSDILISPLAWKSFSTHIVHEFVHYFREKNLIAIDIPTASAFGCLTLFRDHGKKSRYLEKGEYLFKDFSDPEERWNNITKMKFIRKDVTDWREIFIGLKQKELEPEWSYKAGEILAGIAEGLSQKTRKPEDAWEYLSFIALGVDPVEAENSILKNKKAGILVAGEVLENDKPIASNDQIEKKYFTNGAEISNRIVELAEILEKTCPDGIDIEFLNVVTGYKPGAVICLWHNPEQELEAMQTFIDKYPEDYGIAVVLDRDKEGHLEPTSGTFYHKKAAVDVLKKVPSDILHKWNIDTSKDIDTIIYDIEASEPDDIRMGIFYGYPWQDVRDFMKMVKNPIRLIASRTVSSNYTEWYTYPWNRKEMLEIKEKLKTGEKLVEKSLKDSGIEWKTWPRFRRYIKLRDKFKHILQQLKSCI